MSEKIGQSKDREGLRTIVESLVHTAKEMEVSNIKLEERLNASKREILDLHANLEAVRSESLTDPLTQLVQPQVLRQHAGKGHRRRARQERSRCR